MQKTYINKKEIKPKEENFNKALNYCFFLLNRREYSLKEIHNKLIYYQYHPNDIDKVLEYIANKGFQSNRRFAEVFVKNKMNKLGKAKLIYELKQKGIEENLIEEVLYEFLPNDNLYIKEALFKKFNEEKIKEWKKDKELWLKKHKPKIIRFMLSRGFNYNDFKDFI